MNQSIPSIEKNSNNGSPSETCNQVQNTTVDTSDFFHPCLFFLPGDELSEVLGTSDKTLLNSNLHQYSLNYSSSTASVTYSSGESSLAPDQFQAITNEIGPLSKRKSEESDSSFTQNKYKNYQTPDSTPELFHEVCNTGNRSTNSSASYSSPVTISEGQVLNFNYKTTNEEDQEYQTSCHNKSPHPTLILKSQGCPASSPPHKVYKRSRNGCLTCRYRKRRCCETKPMCKECARLGIKCEWPEAGLEYRNEAKEVRNEENTYFDKCFGKIQRIRGTIEGKHYST